MFDDTEKLIEIAEAAARSETRFSTTNACGGELIFASGCVDLVGEKSAELGGKKVLLVTDKGIAATGHPARAAESIRKAGLECIVYDKARENPTTEDVDRCLAVAREEKIDLIVGLGGGSSMDTAKGCNFILTNGGRMQDYWGVGKAKKEMLPFIAVPTTTGTGSECQSFALIADAETHAKMACGDIKSAAKVALLDPQLTVTQPFPVTAHTGVDAISHALETAVCNKRSDESLRYSRAAWMLLNDGFERSLSEPEDIVARAKMQLGAALAGNAIEKSMLGIGHACANPISAHLGTVHGQAIGTMLPHAVRFNRQDQAANETYEEFYPKLEERLFELLEAAEMNKSAAQLGVTPEAIPMLAKEAVSQWTAQFNPVEVTADHLAEVYRAAM